MEDENNPMIHFDEKTQEKIQELQIFEQSFQQLLMQKRSFNYEAGETDYAIKELEKSSGEVFKIIANQVVVKSDKETLISEMKHKKELIEVRLKNIEKQEEEYSKRIEELREEIMKNLPSKTK
jgi:prefoldin beta subunit